MERLRVPVARDDESRAVPVEALVVEAAGGTAVRVVLPVDRLRADQVVAGAEQPDLVPAAGQRDLPAAGHRTEDGEADVAGRAAAGDRDGDVGAAVAREVVADHQVDARGG